MTLEYEGERISYGYPPPRTPEQLALKRRNIEFWSQQTLGQMGCFPEFVAELVIGLLDWTHIIEKHNQPWGKTPGRIIVALADKISASRMH